MMAKCHAALLAWHFAFANLRQTIFFPLLHFSVFWWIFLRFAIYSSEGDLAWQKLNLSM